MKTIPIWSVIFIGLGLIGFAIKSLAMAAGHAGVPPQFYFTMACGLFFGACLLFGGFRLKWPCVISAILTVLSLLGLDLAKWRAGQQSLGDVMVTWGIVGGIFVICILILRRRSRKKTDAA